MGDILRQGGFADTVRSAEYDIDGVFEEIELHQRLDAGAVAAFGPVPIEVA